VNILRESGEVFGVGETTPDQSAPCPFQISGFGPPSRLQHPASCSTATDSSSTSALKAAACGDSSTGTEVSRSRRLERTASLQLTAARRRFRL